MMEWQDYVSQLLEEPSSLDGISLSFDGPQEKIAASFSNTNRDIGVPPIIKASILMLDKMQAHQGKLNIMVFPERIQSIFIFTLVKLLYNISEGKIDHSYDPSSFKKGDRLKFENAIVEFDSVEEINGEKRMKIRLAENLTISASLEYFPLFQHTSTKKKLSTNKQYVEAKKEAAKKLVHMSADQKYLKLLADHKTHMESSIINMTSIINTKEMINGCKLCGQHVKDSILVGQADFEGNVKNIGAGQLGGTPAIVLASDLYAISEMARKGHPIQSIIIDGSNANALTSQLPALDELIRLGVPVTCVTDVVNSFDLQPFLDRGFNQWRWDETSITEKLYDVVPISSDRKTKNCARRKVEYLEAEGHEICTAIRLLYAHRKESETASAQILVLFDRLFSLAFAALRETVPFEEKQCAQMSAVLGDCTRLLLNEKPYLSDKTFEEYSTVISCLKTVFKYGFVLPKHEMLATRLRSYLYYRVALVVPEKTDKTRVQQYWQRWCENNRLPTEIDVLYPSEYYLIPCGECDATIITGWLKRAIMRKSLFGFNTQHYTVLLYDHEKRWKNYDTYKWNKTLDNTENRKVIEKSFTTDRIKVSINKFKPTIVPQAETPKADEYAEIETILRENKYRQYVASGGQRAENETVEAIPVNYVGGYLAFYRTGHKVISASSIIESDSDKIETKFPNELRMGDFIVVREVDRDLVKEMADLILARSGKAELREIATKWKEALIIETIFCSREEIYARLQKAGCTRGYPAVRSWIDDEDMIAPQSKEDLKHIAAVTESGMLTEMLDQVYSAAQIVKTAHTQAGKALSQQLKQRVVAALNDYGDIDPFNIWEPIEMHVEGIGAVKILKVIDIGTPVVVSTTDTNRLINEETYDGVNDSISCFA